MWNYVPFEEGVEICDTQRKPINNKDRARRIEGKKKDSLYPYYGATGQVGYIDDYITDGEFVGRRWCSIPKYICKKGIYYFGKNLG